MKKIILGVIGAGIIGAGVWAGVFAYRNLRGIGPAVRGPKEDIVELLSPPPQSSPIKGEEEKGSSPPLVGGVREGGRQPGEGENRTGMPLKLPPGFSIEVFAKDLGKPRVMIEGPHSDLFVSIPSQGKVVALPDRNSDGIADEVVTVLEGLNRPHGLAFGAIDSWQMYVAESDALTVYEYDSDKTKATGKKVLAKLPDGGNHVTRSIMFWRAPDGVGKILISVGSSCNVCYEKDSRRAAVLVYDFVNGKTEPLARGLRNSVFMTLSPKGEVWATEMGRDLLGDDLPPDEINIIEQGKDYGWPICYGKNKHDAVFDKNVYVRDPCADKVASHIDLPAHSAPLGLAFIPKDAGWPKEYEGDLLVAFHGSWNRSEPTGYKVVRIKLDEQGQYEGMEDFISGWLQSDGTALGRPVDILVQPGGVMYISDDKAGVIYRVMYSPI